MPKLRQGQKTTIDYGVLDSNSHSKVQVVKRIAHEGEVLKCRMNPMDGTSIASILTTGVVNVYDLGTGNKKGSLIGLDDESFCLDWNFKRNGLLVSAAQSTVCVWDVNQNLTQDSESGSQLLKIDLAHGSADQPVNDVKFSPHNDHQILTSGNDGFYKM